MGVIAEGILRGCQGLFTPVSLGYPLSVFNKNSTLKDLETRLLFTFTNSLEGQKVSLSCTFKPFPLFLDAQKLRHTAIHCIMRLKAREQSRSE